MTAQGREVAVGDLSFTVDVHGPDDGAPVLMLHGFPQSRAAWRAQGVALAAAGFRAIAPDQRGYSAGARPAEVEAYAAPNMVADALGLMDALSHPTFHLVGHDWGGQIAWMTALAAPRRIESLAVLSRPHPAAFARALAQDPEQAKRSGHHRSLQDDATVANIRTNDFAALRAMYAGAGVPAAAAQAYIDTLSPPGALEAAVAWYRAGGGGALRAGDTSPATTRTLFIWGDADTTVGRFAAEATADFVTGPYRFEIIPGAGHFLTDEVPEAVNRRLLEHLYGG